MQAIEALPACLTSWAVEEFETVPHHFVEKDLGEKMTYLDALLAVLEPKMQKYCSKRAAKSEFKAVKKIGKRKLERLFPRSPLFGGFGTFKKITHKMRPGFT